MVFKKKLWDIKTLAHFEFVVQTLKYRTECPNLAYTPGQDRRENASAIARHNFLLVTSVRGD